MELKDLKSLIKLVTDTDITEFKMEDKDEKIFIRRGQEKEIIQVSAPVQTHMMPAAPAPAVAPATAPAAAAAPAAEAAVEDDRYEKIISPIVGTVYHKPSPDAEPFVKVGSIVEPGQPLCLVEAMKLFNEIEAEFKCKIVEILKADATPVEYGEALFLVERV
ncbi:MAG: acetyl-CoA carboxylase biotin carboxyl carrier protein [Desulfuromonadales bacterium]|nr:acetyl-CoA carboxylase biotin carboxyl carrier protein [Desulfuromonadales bacterium]